MNLYLYVMGLLKEAFNKFVLIFPNEVPVFFHQDKKGIYAIETQHFIITAKKYVFKGMVSAHAQAVYHAWAKNKKFIMYVEEERKFLVFDPQDIFKNSFMNSKGKDTMFNFKVSQKIGEIPEKVEE